MELHQALGIVIKRERDRRGLTQEVVSHNGGIVITYLRDIERGRCNPSIDIIDRVATGLGVELTSLISQAKEEQLRAKASLPDE